MKRIRQWLGIDVDEAIFATCVIALLMALGFWLHWSFRSDRVDFLESTLTRQNLELFKIDHADVVSGWECSQPDKHQVVRCTVKTNSAPPRLEHVRCSVDDGCEFVDCAAGK